MTAKHDGFIGAYVAAFEAMTSGDLDGAQGVALPEPSAQEHVFMSDRLQRMFARADAVSGLCPLDPSDLRGWHYVLTGSVLLHVAPTQPTGHSRSANGRYTYLEDEVALIRESLAKLEIVLEALDLPRGPVIALDTHESRIVGRAAGSLLGSPTHTALETDEPGLLVAYDVGSLIEPVRKHYVHHRPGQVLFAHTASASTELKPTADFVGALYERRVSPWNRHGITEPNRTDLPSTAPTEDETTLARRIADEPILPHQLDDVEDLTALAVVAQAMDALEACRENGEREPLWRDSPVPR